jgi:hypothetical protein
MPFKSKRLSNGDTLIIHDSGKEQLLGVDHSVEVYSNIIADKNHTLHRYKRTMLQVHKLLIEHVMIQVARDHADYNFANNDSRN